MKSKRYLVTGGLGFIGSHLVKKLVRQGHTVRVLDNEWRGNRDRLKTIENDFEFFAGDMRHADDVERACKGVQAVFHLASVNGTKFFYEQPHLVLDVSVVGICNLLASCEKNGVEELFVASSSEVYQSAAVIPTDEKAPYSIPDPLNPRYSYAVGKIVSETMALHHRHARSMRTVIFRPHNVYGPDMGLEHVIPQLILRMRKLIAVSPSGVLAFPLKLIGNESRAFVYIDDFIDGLMILNEKGVRSQIYHIGTQEEVSIRELANMMAKYFDREINIVADQMSFEGGPPRRCPDIGKMRSLGFSPRVSLQDGLSQVIPWYCQI